MGKASVVGCFVLAIALPHLALAKSWYVDQANGKDTNDGLAPTSAKADLADVVNNKAGQNDIIYLMGTYSVSSSITITQANRVLSGYGDDAVLDGQGKCRVLNVNAYAAVVSNLTIRGGVESAAASSWTYPAAGVCLTAGKLTHCTVTGCRPKSSSVHCSAVQISGTNALVEYCDIRDNDSGIQNTSYAAGVYLNSEGGKLRHSKVHHCRGRAVAVFVEKGLVEDCDIYCNTNYPASQLASESTAGSGAGVRADNDGTRIARCRIYGNCGYGKGGGLWLRNGSIVENSVISGNFAEGEGGAIYCNSGNSNVRFCNIGGNTSATGANAIYVNGGTPSFKDNIIYGNGTGAEIKLENTSAPITYCLLSAAWTGTGNLVATKSPFADAASGNYLTADDSEGIDMGLDLAGVTVDINGVTRPKDGGKGNVTSDIGCVEYVNASALTAPIVYVSKTGSNESPYDTPEKAATSLLSAVVSVDTDTLGYGEVRVAAGVYDASEAEISVNAPIRILGAGATGTVFKTTSFTLNHAGALLSGIAADQRAAAKAYVVKLTQGTVSNCVIRGYRYEIAKDESFGGGALVLSGTDDADADKCCRVVDSVISNSVVTLASDRPLKNWEFVLTGAGVAFRGANALLERCLVSDCRAAGSGAGIAIHSYGGTIRDCEITRCHASITDDVAAENKGVAGGGLYSFGTGSLLIEGCDFHHNYANGSGGGLSLTGSSTLLLNSRITDNEVYAYAGSGLRIEIANSAGRVVNCLIARNRRRQNLTNGPGVYLKGGKLINCTVAGNSGGAAAAGVVCYARTSDDVSKNQYASALHNTIVWGNEPGEWNGTSAKNVAVGSNNTFASVVVPADDGVTGTDIINSDPCLKSDFTLPQGSPAIDAGYDGYYSVANYGDADLAGNARFFKDGTIDIGCFENCSRPGFVLEVR